MSPPPCRVAALYRSLTFVTSPAVFTNKKRHFYPLDHLRRWHARHFQLHLFLVRHRGTGRRVIRQRGSTPLPAWWGGRPPLALLRANISLREVGAATFPHLAAMWLYVWPLFTTNPRPGTCGLPSSPRHTPGRSGAPGLNVPHPRQWPKRASGRNSSQISTSYRQPRCRSPLFRRRLKPDPPKLRKQLFNWNVCY